MNAEMIDPYRKVQKYRGEWKDLENEDVYHPNYSRGVMADPNHGSGLEVWFEKGGWTYLPKDDPDLLWLPPVFSEDGRCLVAMIDGIVQLLRDESTAWTVSVSDGSWGAMGIWTEIATAPTLPEALLRAIASHE